MDKNNLTVGKRQLLGVENDDNFKYFLAENIRNFARVLAKREAFLDLCAKLACDESFNSSGLVGMDARTLRKDILFDAIPEIDEAMVALHKFTNEVKSTVNMEEDIDLKLDIAPYDEKQFLGVDSKTLKLYLKEYTIGLTHFMGRVLDDARKFLKIRELKNKSDKNDESCDEYLESFNFYYISQLNNISASAISYTTIANDLVELVRKNEGYLFSKMSERGEDK